MARKPSTRVTRRTFDAASIAIQSLLPDVWQLEVIGGNDAGGIVRIIAPDGTAGRVAILVHDRFATRDAATLPNPDGPTIIAAPWLSPRNA